MSGTLHSRLRAATAKAHEALERDLDWRDRVVSRQGYRDLLARLRGFHAAYEPAIARALPDAAFAAPRLRLDLVDADLAHLGLPTEAIAALPTPEPPRFDAPAEAMGALYVLEGSRLGGAVIGRHIERLHGFTGDAGCAYYRGGTHGSGGLWRGFLVRLEDYAGEATAGATMRAGVQTFEALRIWLVPA